MSIKRTIITTTIICAAGIAFGQGSLTPPGAPAPTMKTLDELDAAIGGVSNAVEAVEARIDLATVAGNSTYQHQITQPGSYYLSSNLEVTASYGIIIWASGVTLDLNGFEISRVSGNGGDGIYISSGHDRITVRNGSIVGFDRGITSFGEGCLFEKLAVSGCTSYGIYAGIGSGIVDCRAHGNPGNGIFASSGSSLSGCTASKNEGEDGIYAGSGSSLTDCTAYDNQSKYGIYASQGSTLRGCTAYSNAGGGTYSYGIYAGSGSTVVECTASRNSNTNSSSTSAQGVGIYADNGSTIKDCTATLNQGDGIRVYLDSVVSGNACDSNGYNGDGAGIHATGSDNRIEGNNMTDNDRGLNVDIAGNLIVRNSASGNSLNYDIISGNDTGTIQTSPVGAGAWDNFSF